MSVTSTSLNTQETSLEAQITTLKGSFTPSPKQTADLVDLEAKLQNLITELQELQKDPSLATNDDFNSQVRNALYEIHQSMSTAAEDFQDPVSNAFFTQLTSNVEDNVLGFHMDGASTTFEGAAGDPKTLQEYLSNFSTNQSFLQLSIIQPLETMGNGISPYIPISN